ncbi:hypothetical protein BT69DRAFT_1295297 [Atractiella rhizophila]|nr:hypothetical protein BT69DRAFT_1295297 [Atractiella rhizophila]
MALLTTLLTATTLLANLTSAARIPVALRLSRSLSGLISQYASEYGVTGSKPRMQTRRVSWVVGKLGDAQLNRVLGTRCLRPGKSTATSNEQEMNSMKKGIKMDFPDTELRDPRVLAAQLRGFVNQIDVSLQIENICRHLYETGLPSKFHLRTSSWGKSRFIIVLSTEECIQALPLSYDPHSKRIRSYPNRPGWISLSQKTDDTFVKVEIQDGRVYLEIVPAITAARADPSQIIILPRAKYPAVYKDGVEVLLDRDWTEWVKGIAFFIGNCRDTRYRKDFFDETMVVCGIDVPEDMMGRQGNDIFIRPAEITPHFAQYCQRHADYEEFCRLCFIDTDGNIGQTVYQHFKRFP